MGQPYENEFMVKVDLDSHGQPIGVIYYDQEGCGHESESLSFDTHTLADLVNYHDQHRIKSHRQKPRRERCPFFGRPGDPLTQCTLTKNHQSITIDAEEYSAKHQATLEWT